jgi:predicted O-methyltransferase YrrM
MMFMVGKIDEEASGNDSYTKGLQEFNDLIHNDQRVDNVIFPVRDGLMVVRKK